MCGKRSESVCPKTLGKRWENVAPCTENVGKTLGTRWENADGGQHKEAQEGAAPRLWRPLEDMLAKTLGKRQENVRNTLGKRWETVAENVGKTLPKTSGDRSKQNIGKHTRKHKHKTRWKNAVSFLFTLSIYTHI